MTPDGSTKQAEKDYLRRRRIDVEVSLNQDVVHVRIADTGTGIDPVLATSSGRGHGAEFVVRLPNA